MAKKKAKKKVERPPEAQTWDELRQTWAGCTRCVLHSRRKLVVMGGGAVGQFMVIGQAPGRDEDATGLPFQGLGGQYTAEALGVADIPWSACFFDNCLACKCAKPLKEHLNPCQARLEDTIRLAQPKLIIAAGAVASKVLSGTRKSMDSLACTTAEWQGIPVFFVTHPMEPGRLIDQPDAHEKSVTKIRREFQALGAHARETGLLPEEEE